MALKLESEWSLRFQSLERTDAMRLQQEEIYKTLELVNRRYLSVSVGATRYTNVELEYLSKIAIIELSGWVECTIDEILMSYTRRKILDINEQSRIEKSIVARVSGFDFERLSRPLFERILGIAQCWDLIQSLQSNGMLPILISEMDSLWKMRNRAAHTNWNGVTRTFDAPSVTVSRLRRLHPIVGYIKKRISHL